LKDQAAFPAAWKVASEYRYRTVVPSGQNTLLITIPSPGETPNHPGRTALRQGFSGIPCHAGHL